MHTKYGKTGKKYSSQFLRQLEDDLKELTQDYLDCGGSKEDAAQILFVSEAIRIIREENKQP